MEGLVIYAGVLVAAGTFALEYRLYLDRVYRMRRQQWDAYFRERVW